MKTSDVIGKGDFLSFEEPDTTPNKYEELNAARDKRLEDQYKALNKTDKIVDIGSVPVLRSDKKYAGDWKEEPEAALGQLADIKVEYGDNMAIVTAKVEDTGYEEPEESLKMFMKKHKTP